MKKIYTALFAFVIALGANAQIPTNGLIHHFKFDGNLNNAVSSGKSLVVDTIRWCSTLNIPNLDAAYGADRNGNANAAYLLRGDVKTVFDVCASPPKNSVISISNSLISIDTIAFGTGDRAIAFWAKLNKTNTASQIFKFHQGNNNSTGSTFGMDVKGGISPNIAAYTWGGGNNDIVFNTPLDTNWHFFLVTIENSQLYLNIDKSLVGSTNVITGLNTSTGTLRLGQLFAQDSVYIDNVMIYNRSLTANELDLVYADSISCNLSTTHSTTSNSVSISANGLFFPMKVVINNDNGQYSVDSNIMSNSFTKQNLPTNQVGWSYTVTDNTGTTCGVTKSFSLLPNSINDITENLVKLYPNPTSGKITIETAIEIEKVLVLDILGNTIISTEQKQLDLSTQKAGVYFMQVKTDKGVQIKRIIKE